jgi:hypothetical protein
LNPATGAKKENGKKDSKRTNKSFNCLTATHRHCHYAKCRYAYCRSAKYFGFELGSERKPFWCFDGDAKISCFRKTNDRRWQSATVSRPATCSKATISLAGFKSNDKILC